MENIIVTRHGGLVEWLVSRGIEGRVVSHAAPEDVKGRHVYGVLPLHLAVLAASVTVVDMPSMPADRRGQNLTPTEMEEYGAEMHKYSVSDVTGEVPPVTELFKRAVVARGLKPDIGAFGYNSLDLGARDVDGILVHEEMIGQ